MHVGDMEVGMLPAIAIVGAAYPSPPGLAPGRKRLGTDRVAVCFFGEGAANEGAFHEGLNMAAILGAAGDLRVREQPLRGLDAGGR